MPVFHEPAEVELLGQSLGVVHPSARTHTMDLVVGADRQVKPIYLHMTAGYFDTQIAAQKDKWMDSQNTEIDWQEDRYIDIH